MHAQITYLSCHLTRAWLQASCFCMCVCMQNVEQGCTMATSCRTSQLIRHTPLPTTTAALTISISVRFLMSGMTFSTAFHRTWLRSSLSLAYSGVPCFRSCQISKGSVAGRYACRVCLPFGARLGSITEAIEMRTTFCSESTPCSQVLTTMWCSSRSSRPATIEERLNWLYHKSQKRF